MGSSFSEVRVGVDGTPAGIAPQFPSISADLSYFFRETLDLPAPPLQMLNVLPYRVDLTPFAAILNEAGAHTISLQSPITGLDSPLYQEAQLVVYLDKKATRVGGAVTLNTLAGSQRSAIVTDTMSEANDIAQGSVTTALDGHYEIKGYVNTSGGRVYSDVQVTSHFLNVQNIWMDGLVEPNYRHYTQYLNLTSTTQQRGRRTRNGVVLSDDTHVASYPLAWDYDMAGETVDTGDFGFYVYPTNGRATVNQGRNEDFTQIRPGGVRYLSHVRDSFTGTHARDIKNRTDGAWDTFVERRFWDNHGSCREAALNTTNGQLSASTTGEGCPNQTNHVAWFAHPDGSPDGMGWVH